MDDAAHRWFHDVVSALAYSFAQAHAPGAPPSLAANFWQKPDAGSDASAPGKLLPPYNDVTQFVLRQHAQMPDYLRAPMIAATLAFDLFGCLRTGRLFHSRPPAVRARQIAAWKRSKLGFQRDLTRYYESLATFGLYSREANLAQASRLRVPGASAPDVPSPASTEREIAGETPALLSREFRCEIAIVGSGPGGAITACLLAEAGRNVLLIEEGPFYQLESCAPFSKEEMLQKYRNGGQTVALGQNKIAYVEGRCVGGGSEINSGLYHRTPPEILEIWRKQFQVQALTEEDLRPHFEACEQDLSVSFLPCQPPAASLKLHEGAVKLGWKSFEVPRWFRYDGQSAAGTRQSMTKTFLPRFLKAGGQLLPNTRVERIRREGAKWLLQGSRSATGTLRIAADHLFVCGGAVQSPALLRRSGITANIGNSLRLHPTVKIVARFRENVNSEAMGVPVHQVKELAPRLSFGCSISTPPYLALAMLEHASGQREVQHAWPQMAVYYAMITGEGSGNVRPLSGFHDALVRYRLTTNDRRDLADGLRKLAQILFESGAVAAYPGLAGFPHLRSGDDIQKLPELIPAGLASLMTIHLFSSCPMGEDQTKCATDSFGRVHGFDNLFVSDASLLCTAPGVNPQGSIMALARRNALHFLKR